MNFKIDHDVPMPYGKHGNTKYPFQSMEVGDSFLFPQDNGKTRNAAIGYGRRKGMKFTVRCVDPVKGEYRCWRIA